MWTLQADLQLSMCDGIDSLSLSNGPLGYDLKCSECGILVQCLTCWLFPAFEEL